MVKCTEKSCPLWGKMTIVPFEKGKRNDIVWCGESPGKWEESKGKPFYHKADAGSLLRVCLKEAGLSYDDYFFCNSAMCRIDKDNLSTKEITQILAACHSKAVSPIRLLKPKAVVLMGDYALRQVTKKGGITKHRGRWLWNKEFETWMLPTFHPAFILRNMGLKKRLVNDFRMVKEFIDNGYKPLEIDEGRISGYHETESPLALVNRWSNNKDTVAFDTESQGIDWMDPNFLLISYSMSPEKGKAYNVTLYEETTKGKHDFTIIWPRKVAKKTPEPTTVYIKRASNFHEKLQALATLIEDGNIKKYMMHGNHDLHVVDQAFRREKKSLPVVKNYCIDIQAAANLLDENMFKLPSLDDLQMTYTDVREDYKQEFHKKYGMEDMLATPKRDRAIYAMGDADITRRVGVTIKEELRKDDNRKLARYFAKFTMPALSFLRVLETNGALIDKENLPRVTDDVHSSMIVAEDKALDLIPRRVLEDFEIDEHSITESRRAEKFFLTRDELVSETLFGRYGFRLPGVKRTKGKEAWSVDKEVRVALLDDHIPDNAREFLELYNEFADDNTMWSRYLKGFDKNIWEDGRIHSSYSLARTKTGRSSSMSPNMQNNPKKSRQAMKIRELISTSPGFVLMAVDQEQSELRWAAELSGDEEMLQIFLDGRDIHAEAALAFLKRKDPSWTTSRWNKLPQREKELHRRTGKCSNFGLLYGQSPYGYVRYAKKEYGLELTESEAVDQINTHFSKFKKIRPFQQRMVDMGLRLGYVESPIGRRRRLPELHSKDQRVRGEAERMSMNAPIQSISSDVVLLAGVELMKERPKPTEFKPILFVHDELVFEVKENKMEKWAEKVKHAMEHPPLERDFHYKMRVPLKAEIKVGRNLGELKAI